MSENPLWNTATPPVSPKKGRHVRDKLEASPTGRAKCRRCGEKIEKGTKRVGIQGQIQTPQGYPVWRPRYYHSDCVSEETKRKLHLDPPKKRAKRAKKGEKSTVKLKPKLRKQLEADLRGLRQSFAAMQNCDDYKIYPIKSLDDIVKKLPTNETELKECWGIKEKRCDQYGSSILRVVNFYLEQQEQDQQKKPRGKRSASSTSTRANHQRNNNTVASGSAAVANNDDEVEVGPTLSVEDIVAQRVRDAEARGEVFEIVDEE